jgi:cytochrome c553
LAVGRRPTAVAAAGGRAFVVNTLADSVSVIDIDRPTLAVDIALGSMPPLSSAQRGEQLFYDGRLSVEGWMSCHSCHSDGHTSGLRSDTLTDGSYGAAKRVPTLLGSSDTGPWGWNGSVVRLEAQVRQSVRSTMHGPGLSEQQAADLTAYLGALPPPPSGPASAGSKPVQRGKEVFAARGCIRCHAPPTYTTPRTYEVGLEDEMGLRAFNPPSLRGVSHGSTFFHDGRVASLADVLVQHGRAVPADLSAAEREDLVEFLRSL